MASSEFGHDQVFAYLFCQLIAKVFGHRQLLLGDLSGGTEWSVIHPMRTTKDRNALIT